MKPDKQQDRKHCGQTHLSKTTTRVITKQVGQIPGKNVVYEIFCMCICTYT